MELDKPLVSIGIPVYGVEKYIERCARSLFEQTYQNIEYIFLDDCSPDRSIEILMRVAEDYSNRKSQIHFVSHEVNRGLAAARNSIIQRTHGDFIMWVDSDDYIDVTTVAKCVTKQKDFDSDIILYNAKALYKTHSKLLKESYISNSREYVLSILKGNSDAHIWGKMIRLSLYTHNNIFAEEGVNMAEDFQVTPRLIYYANRLDFVNEELYFYNCSNEASYMHNYSFETLNQSHRSRHIIVDFFKNKGCEFENALKVLNLHYAISYFKYFAYSTNADYFYLEGKKLLTPDILKFKGQLSILDRSILLIYKRKIILSIYLVLLAKIKIIAKSLLWFNK